MEIYTTQKVSRWNETGNRMSEWRQELINIRTRVHKYIVNECAMFQQLLKLKYFNFALQYDVLKWYPNYLLFFKAIKSWQIWNLKMFWQLKTVLFHFKNDNKRVCMCANCSYGYSICVIFIFTFHEIQIYCQLMRFYFRNWRPFMSYFWKILL